jgi:hypothetical protein
MTTYPINPSERVQRRICSILTAELLPLPAFTGFVVRDERVFQQEKYPFFSVQTTENKEVFPGINVWNVSFTIAMLEDRQEANTTLGVDPRPRHELRAENVSALLFGVWDGLSLPQAINAIVDGDGVTVLKMTGTNQANGTMSEDEISTEYSFTLSCTSTQQ